MNAYLIDQDGESMVWLGKTMQAALDDAWEDHRRELIETGHFDDEDPEFERLHYEQTILRSCSLIAEVGTVRPTPEELEQRRAIAEIDMGDED